MRRLAYGGADVPPDELTERPRVVERAARAGVVVLDREGWNGEVFNSATTQTAVADTLDGTVRGPCGRPGY